MGYFITLTMHTLCQTLQLHPSLRSNYDLFYCFKMYLYTVGITMKKPLGWIENYQLPGIQHAPLRDGWFSYHTNE